MSVVRKTFNLNGVNLDFCAFVTSDNKVYYKLRDFSDFLGYFYPTRAYKLIDEKFKVKWSQLSEHPECSNWHPNTIFVSEPGIYSLMFRSRILEAKQFNFVFDVVLPAIQNTVKNENPNIAASQANSLIQTLREKLLEKERLLTETREVLADRERTLTGTLADRERTLMETRAALEEKNRMLVEIQAALEEKNQMLVNEMQQKRQLQNDIQTVRSKVAVTPDNDSVRYTLCVYQHENTYKFIRAQKRCLAKARRRIPDDFKLVYSVSNVPNPFHIVNRLKELLPQCKVRYNTITSDANVIDLIKQCI